MSKPAAMQGSYVHFEFKPGLKVGRIHIDIPEEHSEQFFKMFGTPNKVSPVWVAIARLNAASVPEKPEVVEPESKPKAERSRSQIAALKLQDKDFCEWLDGPYYKLFEETFPPLHPTPDCRLKAILSIDSKRELDQDGPKARAFDALMTDYRFKDMVR